MLALLHESFPHLLHTYGAWIVAMVIALECVGVPLPGETALISAAVYAGTTHRIAIVPVLIAALLSAVLGGAAGFWLGRAAGTPLLLRHGRHVGLTERRLKLGQYLFLQHGGKIVFFGRFIAVVRALAALLAGANGMGWSRFMLFNITSGVVWTLVFGAGAYALGNQMRDAAGPIGYAALALVVAAIGGGALLLHRHHARIQARAELAFPGPLLPRI